MLVISALNGKALWRDVHRAVGVQVAVALKAPDGRSWGRRMVPRIEFSNSEKRSRSLV